MKLNGHDHCLSLTIFLYCLIQQTNHNGHHGARGHLVPSLVGLGRGHVSERVMAGKSVTENVSLLMHQNKRKIVKLELAPQVRL